jgi:hypothetical protein
MAGDFIPHQGGTFLEWAKTLLAYVSPKLTAFNIPAETLTPIQGLLTAKENMGLPLHDGTRTSAPVPTTIPELELDSSVIRQITVHFKDAGSDRRGKPSHAHGVELQWGLLDNAPSSVEGLKNSAFDTASPYTFKFDEPDRGRVLYFCPRWENNKGDKGPWVKFIRQLFHKIWQGGFAALFVYMR